MLRQLERDRSKYPRHLVEIEVVLNPPPGWEKPTRILRSRDFLVQVFTHDPGAVARLSVNRTEVDEVTWRWKDGITWDDLQLLKREAGYGDFEAVEIYPADRDQVNVANLRHLWVLTVATPFSWKAP